MQKKFLKLTLALLALPGLMQAQTLKVKQVELRDGSITVHYSLLDTMAGRTYTVNMYASRDNYINPLTLLSGDHGIQVKPGNERSVTWNAKQELGQSFQGQVSVELRARAYIAFILFDDFDKIKRGKHKEVTWRGGTKQNVLNFELYNKKGEKVAVIPNVPNAGYTSLLIPNDIKPGKGYSLKIVDNKNKDQVVTTQTFAVKRRTPLGIVAAAIAAIGGGAVLLSGDDGGTEGNSPIVDPFPTPDGI